MSMFKLMFCAFAMLLTPLAFAANYYEVGSVDKCDTVLTVSVAVAVDSIMVSGSQKIFLSTTAKAGAVELQKLDSRREYRVDSKTTYELSIRPSVDKNENFVLTYQVFLNGKSKAVNQVTTPLFVPVSNHDKYGGMVSVNWVDKATYLKKASGKRQKPFLSPDKWVEPNF